MNRPALRHAVRAFTPWFLAAVALVYIAAAIWSGGDPGTTWVYAAIFVVAAILCLRYRYTEHSAAETYRAERAAFDAERNRLLEQHTAAMAEIARKREEREAERRAQYLADVEAGRICPDDCDGCARDDAERRKANADFLAERALRHRTGIDTRTNY